MSAPPSRQASAVSPELALVEPGRAPHFAEKLHVGRPNIPDRAAFLERVNAALDRKWLTNDGPLVRELEARIAAHVHARHCVAMCNGTVALELAIRALDLSGEVIVPSYTFIASAHALRWQHITPVFADIDERSHCLDPVAVERAITARTTAILGVHLWGRPCAVEALADLAQRHRLCLLFDAAHAFSCSHAGRMVGTHGRCEIFSFHATKFFNTGEGGAVITNDEALAQKLRLMRNFGFAGYDKGIHIGTNAKMSELSAALGLANLDAVPRMIEVNRANFLRYRQTLHGIPGLRLVDMESSDRRNFQYVVIEVDPTVSPLTRDELVAVLWAENVVARRYFWPGCHRMEPYRTDDPEAGRRLPVTERVAAHVLLLPTGMAVDTEAIEAIGSILRRAMVNAGAVRETLSAGGAK